MKRTLRTTAAAALLGLACAAAPAGVVHWCVRCNSGQMVSVTAPDFNAALAAANVFCGGTNGGIAPDGFHCQNPDWDGNRIIQPVDVGAYINDWIISVTTYTFDADYDADGVVNQVDIAAFVTDWFENLRVGFCT